MRVQREPKGNQNQQIQKGPKGIKPQQAENPAKAESKKPLWAGGPHKAAVHHGDPMQMLPPGLRKKTDRLPGPWANLYADLLKQAEEAKAKAEAEAVASQPAPPQAEVPVLEPGVAEPVTQHASVPQASPENTNTNLLNLFVAALANQATNASKPVAAPTPTITGTAPAPQTTSLWEIPVGFRADL